MALKSLTAENFAHCIAQERLVVVDVWAEWCGPCRQLTPMLESLSERFGGKVEIVKVNVDDYPELVQPYEVMKIPNLLFFRQGSLVDQLIGLRPEQEIAERIEGLLARPQTKEAQ